MRPTFVKAVGLGVLGVVVSSVLLLLALPLGEQWYLAPIAFVPILVTTRKRGFVAGFVASIASLMLTAWIASKGWFYGEDVFGEGDAWLYTACGTFGFAAAVAGAFAADKKLGEKPPWLLAAIALLFEALLLLELPGHIALTQYRSPLMLAVASVGGVWLVSFLIWWANLWISRLDFRRDWWKAAALVAVFFVGHWAPFLGGGGRTMKVAAIQIPSDRTEDIEVAHRRAAEQGAELAVWCEFGGIIFSKNGTDFTELKDLSRVIPIATSYPDTFRPLPHNVASIVSNGEVSPLYFKRKLFGQETKMHTPGDRPMQVDFKGKKIGLGVCYDSCFPFITREATRGADLMTLPTNDPPSPYGFLAAMHAAYTPFRCAETGVGIVRADSLAFSHIVAPGGKILAEAGIGDDLLVADVPLDSWTPPAMFLGDGMLYAAGVMAIAGFWRRRPSADV